MPAKNPDTQLAEAAASTRVEKLQPVVHTVEKPVSTRVDKPQLSQTLRAYIQRSELMPKLDAAAPEHRRIELRKCRDAGVMANVMQGYWLADIQACEGSEALRAACAELNIGKSACYYSIAQFHLFNQFSDLDVVQALGALEPTKFRALSFEHQEWCDFARGAAIRGVTLDSAVEMSQRDLLQQQREWQAEHDDRAQKLERENARLRTQLDVNESLRKQMARAGAALQAEEDLPMFALAVRQEYMALTESMSFALDNLQAIADQHLFAEVKHPEAHRYQPVAAGTAYFALSGVAARCQALMQKLGQSYGDQLGMVTRDHQLSPAELKRFAEQRAQLLAMHEADARSRDNARENNRPGKRGAKRK